MDRELWSVPRLRCRDGSRRASALGIRALAWVLAAQQLTFALPAAAAVNAPMGLPVDAPALARFAQNRALGVSAGSFAGDAELSIPLLVPPGTGGHAPAVALSYSSGAAQQNGPLGVGWSLDIGPAVIERSTRNGAPEYDGSDTFELGGERLRATAMPGRYVAESHDFSRIERLTGGGADYWRVLRPDGTRLYYGFEPGPDPLTGSILYNVRIDASDPTTASCPMPFQGCSGQAMILPGSIPYAWHLDRIEDRNGNVIRLRWESLLDPGMRYLTEITYTEHVPGDVDSPPAFGAADSGALSSFRRIGFFYDPSRTDALPKYRTGFPRQAAHRLERIDVSVGAELVRRYLLEYEQSPVSGRSRLVTLRERDRLDTAATERVHAFSYGDGGAPSGPGGRYWSALDSRWALPGGLSFTQGGADEGVRLVDVNTDGYPDVVEGYRNSRETYLGGPNGFDGAPTTAWELPASFVDADGYLGLVMGDLDGDGRQDLLRRLIEITAGVFHTELCGSQSKNRHQEVASGAQGSLLANEAWRNSGSGWLSDASHAATATRFTTQRETTLGNPNSCPYEYLPMADRIDGERTGYDQGTRVVDINGDGYDDIVYLRALSGRELVGTTEPLQLRPQRSRGPRGSERPLAGDLRQLRRRVVQPVSGVSFEPGKERRRREPAVRQGPPARPEPEHGAEHGTETSAGVADVSLGPDVSEEYAGEGPRG